MTRLLGLGPNWRHGAHERIWGYDRFNYDYPEHELQQLVPSILDLERRAELVQVIFNNNYEDQGQRNATTSMNMLH